MARHSGVALTKRVVDAAAKRGARYHLWDKELSGFALRVQPSGEETPSNTQVHGGGRSATQHWFIIGRHGPLTPDKARKIAKAKLGAVAAGAIPRVNCGQSVGDYHRRTH